MSTIAIVTMALASVGLLGGLVLSIVISVRRSGHASRPDPDHHPR